MLGGFLHVIVNIARVLGCQDPLSPEWLAISPDGFSPARDGAEKQRNHDGPEGVQCWVAVDKAHSYVAVWQLCSGEGVPSVRTRLGRDTFEYWCKDNKVHAVTR